MNGNFILRMAWIFFSLLAGLLLLSGIFVLLEGVDPNDFQASTGKEWSSFSATQSEGGTYLVRLERLIGVATISVSMFSFALSLQAFRRKEAWAYYAMWIVPFSLFGYTAVFFTHNASFFGFFYLGAALICSLMLLFGRPVVQA